MMLNNLFLFYAPANDISALIFLFSYSEFILNVDTMLARDMYQVYEINDDWFA